MELCSGPGRQGSVPSNACASCHIARVIALRDIEVGFGVRAAAELLPGCPNPWWPFAHAGHDDGPDKAVQLHATKAQITSLHQAMHREAVQRDAGLALPKC